MREMVYDDTRWVQRLRCMGCWNEAEARKRFEDTMRRKAEEKKRREQEEAGKAGFGMEARTQPAPEARPENRNSSGVSTTLFDAGWDQGTPTFSPGNFGSLTGGPLSPTSPTKERHSDGHGVDAALGVFRRVQSIRGRALHEFGKIYAVLGPFYFDLVHSQSHMNAVLFRAFRNPEQQAQMLANLKTFAKSDFALGWYEREHKLDSMTGVFENAVLREFEQGFQANDTDGRMKKYAHVLVVLNGGSAGIDSFIHNHPLMLEKDALGNPMDCLRSAGADSVSLQVSHDFFRRLSGEINDQSSVIDRVFPETVDVLLPFVDRVVEDILSDYITTLFDEAHNRTPEAYLKAVSGVFEQSQRFAHSLISSKGSKKSFTEDICRAVARCFEPHTDLYLQDELEFFKRRSEAEVTAWEKQLSEQEASTESFLMSNVNRQADKRDFLSSFKKVVMMPVNVLPTMPFTSSKSSTTNTMTPQITTTANGDALEVPSRTSTPSLAHSGRSPSPRTLEAPTTELAAKAAIMTSRLEGIRSLFSIEIALNLTHNAKTSLERVALFVRLGGQTGEEAREQCENIFVLLLQTLGGRHIKPGFDKAVAHLSDYRPREHSTHDSSGDGTASRGVEPLVTFLELVNVGDLIQQMVDVFYVQELTSPRTIIAASTSASPAAPAPRAPLVDRDDFLSPANKEKKRFEQMLDERVAAGLNRGIEVLLTEVEHIFGSTQKPSDFNPDGPAAAADASSGPVAQKSLDVGPTTTSAAVIATLRSHTQLLHGSTDKSVLDVFLTELGLRLFGAICKHVKRQRVSVAGAARLISDFGVYADFAAGLRQKSLYPYYTALRTVSQLFLVDARDAKDVAALVADGSRYGGVFTVEEVLEFASRRADWLVIKGKVEKGMYGAGCGLM